MPSVLIVERDTGVGGILERSYWDEGYVPMLCGQSEQAEGWLANRTADLVVFDWTDPEEDGPAFCRRLRELPRMGTMPIIVIGPAERAVARLGVIGECADDYLPKPYSIQELMARSNILLRRDDDVALARSLIVKDIVLNRNARRVFRGDREIRLGPTEYRLLELFMSDPTRVYSRAQILDAIWPSDTRVDERTVDVHVGRLRKAMNVGRRGAPIRTIRGMGYALQ